MSEPSFGVVHMLDLNHIMACIICAPQKSLKLYCVHVFNIPHLPSFYGKKGRWRKLTVNFPQFDRSHTHTLVHYIFFIVRACVLCSSLFLMFKSKELWDDDLSGLFL